MKRLLLWMAVVLPGAGPAGCLTAEPEPPAKALEKKVDDLGRKVEEIQAILTEVRQARKAASQPAPYPGVENGISSAPMLRRTTLVPDRPKAVSSSVPDRVQMVNTRRLRLSYDLFDLGKSDVERIEVWATQDTQAWRKLTEKPPANPSVSIPVEVEKEGRWGFKLIAVTTLGRSESAPERGHQPDCWVEVDETNPAVILYTPEVSGGPENGQMTIRWMAEDRHLAERPITINYTTDGKGWTTIVSGLHNDGRYVWSIPPDLPHSLYYIRVEAVDQAGNVGMATTPQPIVTELSIPKARIKAVKVAPQAEGPASASESRPIVPVTGIEPASPIPAPPMKPMQASPMPAGPV
jgi:hypothetical protein